MAAATAPAPQARPRLYFLDNLKVLLIILVILHHAGQPYGPGGVWYVEGTQRSGWLGLLFTVNNAFFMSLMFFISGYFLPGSFDRKGAGAFLRDRLLRLGVPLVVFPVVIFPLLGYAYYITFQGGALPLGRFLADIYFRQIAGKDVVGFQFGHLWFLEHLLLYALIYAGWRLLWARVAPKAARSTPTPTPARVPGGWAILGFAVTLALIAYPFRYYFPWRWEVVLGFIQVELVKLPTHLIAFVMGTVAYRRNWLVRLDALQGKRWFWTGIALIGVSVTYQLLGIRLVRPAQLVVDVTWESLLGVSLSVGLLLLFRERWNRGSALGRWLGANSYGVYLLHLPVVVVLQYALLRVALDPLAKFALVGIAAIPLTFLVSHLVRRIPGVDRVV